MKITKPNITPGPWKVSNSGYYVENDSDRVVECISVSGIQDATAIAVVPELFDAVIDWMDSGNEFRLYEKLQVILEKAGCKIED